MGYAPPTGAFLLVEEAGVCAGCVGVRQSSDGIGGINRLYVILATRRYEIWRLIAEGIVAIAMHLGYTRLLLDTLPSMKEAQSVYVALGFKLTSAYRFNPVTETVFLELELRWT